MLAGDKLMGRVSAVVLLASLALFSQQSAQSKDASDRAPVVTWSADLRGENETPAVSTKATAKVEFVFDFHSQTAKFQMTRENLPDVSKVVLLGKGPQATLKGAVVLALYDAAEGPALPKTDAYTKTFTGSAFKQIANAVLNGTGVVEVTTKAHPSGEIVGLVQMHKEYR